MPPYYPDTDEVRGDIATHYDNIAYTDRMLGTLYDRLEREGLLETSILIVSTDHGDGLPRMKRSVYDSGLRVPMIIRYPDERFAGTVDDQLISFVDLAPSVLEIAGIEKPDWIQGQSFLGATADEPRAYIFAAHDRTDDVKGYRRAVRDNRYKLIRNERAEDPYFSPLSFRDVLPTMKALWTAKEAGTLPAAAEPLFEPLPRLQLYDTLRDPHEINNLASDPSYAEESQRLERALEDWIGLVGDMSEHPEEQMIEMFWPGGVQPETLAPAVETTPVSQGFAVALSSPTVGASVGYRFAGQDRWRLYVEPFNVDAGAVIEAKAIRYGYSESVVTELTVE